MTTELVFNELSLGGAPAVEAARETMLGVVRICFMAQNAGAGRVLLVPESAVTAEISPGYSVWHWVNDPQVDVDWRRKFLSMATHGPFTEDVMSAEMLERLSISEYSVDDKTALGLGAAHVLEGLAVSADSGDGWHDVNLRVGVIALTDSGELVEDEVEVRNAATVTHIEEHRAWLAAQKQSEITDGAALWQRRGELFPALEFCARVEEQLCALGPRDPHFKQVLRKLAQIDGIFRDWKDGPFDRRKIPDCDPESRVTLQQFRAEHSFACPDGETRLFSWHVALTPGAWRLFFKPEKHSRKAIIGHIGPKLPNVSYVT